MYTLEGVSSIANFITAYEESQNQDSHLLIWSVFFVSKGNLFDVYFTTLHQVLMSCGGYKTSPVLYHTADYILFPLGSLGPLWYLWKWRSARVNARGRKQCCKLHYCLWRVSIKPRLSFSNLQRVLRFQRQSFYCHVKESIPLQKPQVVFFEPLA